MNIRPLPSSLTLGVVPISPPTMRHGAHGYGPSTFYGPTAGQKQEGSRRSTPEKAGKLLPSDTSEPESPSRQWPEGTYTPHGSVQQARASLPRPGPIVRRPRPAGARPSTRCGEKDVGAPAQQASRPGDGATSDRSSRLGSPRVPQAACFRSVGCTELSLPFKDRISNLSIGSS